MGAAVVDDVVGMCRWWETGMLVGDCERQRQSRPEKGAAVEEPVKMGLGQEGLGVCRRGC